MGRACSTYRRERGELHIRFWWGNLREGDHLEDPDVDRRMIFTGSSRSGMGDINWIDLAQGRDRWRAFANAVINLRVP
jgi:hypothetical protein